MIPVDQTQLHGGKTKGNCLRACLASILEIDIEAMPHFEEKGEYWFTDLRRWMRKFNGKTVHVFPGTFKPEGYCLAAGMSPRNIYHCVVCLDGEIVHDPHPSKSGLVSIERYWVIAKDHD
jgi:hypothetical protein